MNITEISPLSIEKLEKHLTSTEPIQISVLVGPNPYGLPVVFIGKMYHRLLLFPEQITFELLERLLTKTVSDNNRKGTADLLRYIGHNERGFWEKHKHTGLGIQIMAMVLGHD